MAWNNLQSYFDVKRSSCKYFSKCSALFKFITIETLQFTYENYNEFTNLSESVSTNQMAWKSPQSYFTIQNINTFQVQCFVLSLLHLKLYKNFNEFTDLSESVSTNQMAWKSLQSYFKKLKIDSFLSAVLLSLLQLKLSDSYIQQQL